MTDTLVVSYCFDLTRADSKTMEMGRIQVRGDDYLGFEWSVDPEGILPHLEPMSAMMVRNMPDNLRHVAETWLPFKNRSEPLDRKAHDPGTLTEYFCKTLRHSSYYISMVKSG